MVEEFTMPKLGHLMEEGTVMGWKKQEGEQFVYGEVLLEVESEKAILDVEALCDGILVEILVEAGQTVPVGAPLALFDRSSGA